MNDSLAPIFLQTERGPEVPINVIEYIVIGAEVWQREPSGRRRVATCSKKAAARRIARLLNDDLAARRAADPRVRS